MTAGLTPPAAAAAPAAAPTACDTVAASASAYRTSAVFVQVLPFLRVNPALHPHKMLPAMDCVFIGQSSHNSLAATLLNLPAAHGEQLDAFVDEDVPEKPALHTQEPMPMLPMADCVFTGHAMQ